MIPEVRLYKNGGNIHLPERKHPADAGADVYAPTDETIPAHGSVCYDLGFGVEIPEGYVGLVFPRSGKAGKGIGMELPPIDCGYTGNIHAVLTNHTDEDYLITEGERIAQLVILPAITPVFRFMEETEETKAKALIEAEGARGNNGFGSTGSY